MGHAKRMIDQPASPKDGSLLEVREAVAVKSSYPQMGEEVVRLE